MFILLVTTVLLGVLVAVTGREFMPEDVGDTFEKAGEIVRYADERLAALATGEAIPEPPALLADQTVLRWAMGTSLLHQLGTIALVIAVTRKSPMQLLRGFGMTRYRLTDIWRPAVLTIAGYIAVAAYALAMNATDFELLKPESTVPVEIVRENSTILITALVAVIGAPIAEEALYRGVMFSGFARWGFWPAALISSAIFASVHLDPGSIIPFTIIGVMMAWLFWSRGNLWDAIIFHFLFNFTSFAILASLELSS